MKKSRFVPFEDNNTDGSYGSEYYCTRSNSIVKGATFGYKKKYCLSLVTTETGQNPMVDIIEDGAKFVEETLIQHNWKL